VASLGAQLKQEREKQGISLDDISLTTKIGTRMLRALEEEQFDQLPGGIFNKGFIRAYARCLHMDEEQAIADYLAATGVTALARKSDNNEQLPVLDPPPREENPAAAGVPWNKFAIVLLIVAVGFTGWGFYSRESQKPTQISAAPAGNASAQATAAEPSPPVEKLSEPVNPPAATSSPSEPQVAAAVPATPSPAGATPASTPSATQPQPATPASRTFLVSIKAHADSSWVSISLDGEVVTRAMLIAPSEKSVRAEKEIVIRAGNVGALDFEFNGAKLPRQGNDGEAKTLIFDVHGLQPSAPKPEEPAQLP
jgi:cytoskeleton protein RodZ